MNIIKISQLSIEKHPLSILNCFKSITISSKYNFIYKFITIYEHERILIKRTQILSMVKLPRKYSNIPLKQTNTQTNAYSNLRMQTLIAKIPI